MTYNVFGGTLNLTQPTHRCVVCWYSCGCDTCYYSIRLLLVECLFRHSECIEYHTNLLFFCSIVGLKVMFCIWTYCSNTRLLKAKFCVIGTLMLSDYLFLATAINLLTYLLLLLSDRTIIRLCVATVCRWSSGWLAAYVRILANDCLNSRILNYRVRWTEIDAFSACVWVSMDAVLIQCWSSGFKLSYLFRGLLN